MVKDTRARNPAFAFFLFHLHVGTRLALRTFVPLVCVVFALFYILKPEFFFSLADILLQSGFLLSGLPATFFSLTVAGLASRRIGLGLSGWIRHLPVDSATHRRTAGLAVFIAQSPALIILAILGLAASEMTGLSAAPYLAGLPLLGLASGLAVLPVKRRTPSRVLAILACLCFFFRSMGIVSDGAVLLAAADRISGPLTLKRKRPVFRRTFPGKFFLFSLGWRALWPRLFIPYVLALFPLGAARLFALNNNPAPALSDAVARFGGAMGLVIFSALFSHLLALGGPPGPGLVPCPGRPSKESCRIPCSSASILFPFLSFPRRWASSPRCLSLSPPLLWLSGRPLQSGRHPARARSLGPHSYSRHAGRPFAQSLAWGLFLGVVLFSLYTETGHPD